MPLDLINVGEAPNDGTGDSPRVAGQKINANFQLVNQDLAAAVASLQAQIAALPSPPPPVLPIVGEPLWLPYPVELTAGLWTSPQGLVCYAPHGNTIGAPDSGADVATTIAEALFKALWAHIGAATPGYALQTSTGSASSAGVSAAADWAANKRLVVPDYRGRALIAAGQGGGLTARQVGDRGGAEAVALTADNNGPHGHIHGIATGNTGGQDANVRTMVTQGFDNASIFPLTNASGLGTPHNNMPPWAAFTLLFYMGVAP